MCVTTKRHVCGLCLKLRSLLKTHYKQVNNAAAKAVLDVDSYMKFKPVVKVARKFDCILCDKTFQHKKSLRIHLLAHSKIQKSPGAADTPQEIKQDQHQEQFPCDETESRVESKTVKASTQHNETTEDRVDSSLRRSKRKPALPKKSSKRKQHKPAKKIKIKKRKCTRKQSVCDFCNSHFQTKKELKSHIKAAHGDTTEEDVVDDAIPDDISDHEVTEEPFENVVVIKPDNTIDENLDTEKTGTEKRKTRRPKPEKSDDESGPQRHKCEHCGFKTVYKVALHLHLKRKHNIDPPESEIPSPAAQKAKKRKVDHIDENVHSCALCEKKFREKRYLQRHLKEIHQEFPSDDSVDYDAPTEKMDVPYLLSKRKSVRGRKKEEIEIVCEFCSKIFDVRHKYIAHKRQHTNEKPYPCEICGRRFASRSNLGPHLRTHTGEKPHKCEHCDRTFNSITSKKKHLLTHTREYNHSCHICGRQFLLKSHLTEHLKRHMGVKKHQCDQCPKAFVTSGSLKEHYRTHTGERPYICPACGKAFARLCHLKSHTKTQHDDQKKGLLPHNHPKKTQGQNKPHQEPQKTAHLMMGNMPGGKQPVSEPGQPDVTKAAALSLKNEEQSNDDGGGHLRVPARPHEPQEPQYNMETLQGMMRDTAAAAPVTHNQQHFSENGLLNLTTAQARAQPPHPREQYDMYQAMRREGFLNDHQHLHDLGLLNQIQFLNPSAMNSFM